MNKGRSLVVGGAVLALLAVKTWSDTRATGLAFLHAQASGAAATEAYADRAGKRIWYSDSGGSGTPVVLVHARTGSTPAWEHQLPVFSRAGYRVIAYDRPGHGRSEMTQSASEARPAADDLDALLSHLGVDRFHLVGTAAGGIVSLDYALSFPHRLRSLVVANSVGGVQDEDYVALGRRLRPSPQFETLPPEFRELGPSYRAGNPQGTERWMKVEEQSRSKNRLSTPEKMRNRITWSLLETIKIPTLLLTGDADLYTPPTVLELFSQRIKTSTTVILPGVGHSAYWEQPELFNRAVLDFIRQH
jgi:pimeloyl-ACP methyl ester carboxylesterase